MTLDKSREPAGSDFEPVMTRNQIPRLSKSRFMSGRQCHKPDSGSERWRATAIPQAG
jgi:hypothetical protein